VSSFCGVLRLVVLCFCVQGTACVASTSGVRGTRRGSLRAAWHARAVRPAATACAGGAWRHAVPGARRPEHDELVQTRSTRKSQQARGTHTAQLQARAGRRSAGGPAQKLALVALLAGLCGAAAHALPAGWSGQCQRQSSSGTAHWPA